MTDADALTAFIRARSADEERDAQAAPAGPWSEMTTGVGVFSADHRIAAIVVDGRSGDGNPSSWPHIARQDPAATLARVAALRALVEHLARTEAAWNRRGIQIYDVAETAEAALRHVAAIWRDHPDHQPEWVTSE